MHTEFKLTMPYVGGMMWDAWNNASESNAFDALQRRTWRSLKSAQRALRVFLKEHPVQDGVTFAIHTRTCRKDGMVDCLSCTCTYTTGSRYFHTLL